MPVQKTDFLHVNPDYTRHHHHTKTPQISPNAQIPLPGNPRKTYPALAVAVLGG
jgi:hypothetical protein